MPLNLIPVSEKDLEKEELSLYASLKEPQLLHYREPDPGLFIAETPMVIERALSAGYQPVSVLIEEKLLRNMGDQLTFSCPVYVCSGDTMSHITGYKLARGMLSAMERKLLPAVSEITAEASRIAVLEDVMNPTNVGAIFRSAAALGMDAVLLTPGCSDPCYRRAARVSCGTVFQVPWTFLDPRIKWPEEGFERLHQAGFRIAAMSLREDSRSIRDPALLREDKLAILLGTEGFGLSQKSIDLADDRIIIPMQNGVDSLNVAAASAVAFYQLGHSSGSDSCRGVENP